MIVSSLAPHQSARWSSRRTALRSLTLLLCLAFFGLVTAAKLAQYDAEGIHSPELSKSTKIEESRSQKQGVTVQEVLFDEACAPIVVLLLDRPFLTSPPAVAPQHPASRTSQLRSPPFSS